MLTKQLLKEFWAQDPVFIEQFHEEAGDGLDTCVNNTWERFKSGNIEFKLVYHETKPIGFYGIEQSLIGEALTGFFIVPEFRNRQTVDSFWETAISHFSSFFWIGVGKNNIPAHKFIEKKGGKRIMESGKGVFYFIDRSVTCLG